MSLLGTILVIVLIIIVGATIVRTIMGVLSLAVCGISFAYLSTLVFSYLVNSFNLNVQTWSTFMPVIGFCVGWGVYESISKLPIPFVKGLTVFAIGAAATFVFVYQRYPSLITQFIK